MSFINFKKFNNFFFFFFLNTIKTANTSTQARSLNENWKFTFIIGSPYRKGTDSAARAGESSQDAATPTAAARAGGESERREAKLRYRHLPPMGTPSSSSIPPSKLRA